MAWKHRMIGRNHHWEYEEMRRFGDKEVWAKAEVDSSNGDNDASANWQTWRDGSPIARGYGTVAEAKKRAFRALWKGRAPRGKVRNYGKK